ncbi:MAG: Crp/Fnr family transcriptional regulator [Bacteroidia bacterium]|nr:Crp/Fnr family transcriptional regulator [Bacteroidia bacterium]
MMKNTWHLSEQGFFSDLPEEVTSAFFDVAQCKLFKKNEFVFHEGDESKHCYYLNRGSIRIFHFTELGKEPTIFLRNTGELFGLAEIIDSSPRQCNAQAIIPSELFTVEKSDFEQLMSKHYQLTRKIMNVLGRRLRYLGEQMENLMICDVHTRIAKMMLYLVHHAFEKSDPEQPVTVPLNLSQTQIASMTGSCQQTVSNAIKKMNETGLIRLEKRLLTIKNPAKLMEFIYKS